MTTQSEIGTWFDEGIAQGASHMLVIVDTFDYEDYPVFVKSAEEVRNKAASPGSMQRVMEIYNLALDKQTQLNATRVYNF